MEPALHLFEGFGIELEYTIVSRTDLAVLPIADAVLSAAAGPGATEYEVGPIAWSNELVLHLIEVKTNGPTPAISDKLVSDFNTALGRIERIARPLGGRLLPTGMHPTMNPRAQTVLWPHSDEDMVATYDRIFDCQGHGWSNVQSCQLNLPFHGSEEFGRLHAAVRVVLPLLPALAASSPIMDGKVGPALDNRLLVYRTNQARVPSIVGAVIPEPVYTPADYMAQILKPMYRDIAPLDPRGILTHDWLNSRGAIARFDRNAIEVRLMDAQETPLADLAIARLVATSIEALDQECCAPRSALRGLPTQLLVGILERTIQSGEEAMIEEPAFLALFGLDAPCTAKALWATFYDRQVRHRWLEGTPLRRAVETILERGPLARRILTAVGPQPSPQRIAAVYQVLAECLAGGRLFLQTSP